MASSRKRPIEASFSTEEIKLGSSTPQTLSRPISPPTKKRRVPEQEDEQAAPPSQLQIFKSPFQLTKIRDYPDTFNQDTVTLKDLLGDPLIAECWEFNYLHDIDFLMAAFDEDVRALVKVHVVHGFWKKDDAHRLGYEADAARYPNVSLHPVYLPEMFGTHHSKMLILLRHDDTAQVIIHTANMIPRDWTNMTQAAWSSPMLPLLNPSQPPPPNPNPPIGSGEKFKIDLLNYLHAYDPQRRRICKPIADKLARYDFSTVKGALIASVPGRFRTDASAPTRFGWPAIKETLKSVPVSSSSKADIAIQISSIATLGPTDTWLRNTFLPSLSVASASSSSSSSSLSGVVDYKVIFPTPDEIRRSLDGYASGASIHTKTQSSQQAKQLVYLHPRFYHWANDCPKGVPLPQGSTIRDAGRKRAAPHIKTYIRFAEDGNMDWVLLTSANLSKQAWGEARNASTGEVRIASYEIGVLVWPGLYDQGAVMKGAFCSDMVEEEGEENMASGGESVVSLRMPYSLPLQRYGKDEVPWVATASYTELDWMGKGWRN